MDDIDLDGDGTLFALVVTLIALPFSIYKVVTKGKSEESSQNHQETSCTAEERCASERSNTVPHASKYAGCR